MSARGKVRQASEQIAEGMLKVGNLAVADRRWSAPMLASALGLGLFMGTALGPGSERSDAGTLYAVEGSGAESAAAVEPPADADGGGSSGGGSSGGGTPTDSDATTPAPDVPAPLTTPPPTPAPEDPPPPPPPPGGGGGGGKGLTLSGVVIQANPAAGSYALSDGGQMYAIHAEKLPPVGAELEVPVTDLANGTYEEAGSRAQEDTMEEGSLEGLVTFVRDGAEPGYTVSAPGVSAFVHAPDDGALPTVGQFVIVDVDIEQVMSRRKALRRARRLAHAERLGRAARRITDVVDASTEQPEAGQGCTRQEAAERPQPAMRLLETDLVPSGDEYAYGDLAGIVDAVCPETNEIAITADGRGESGEAIVVTVPEEFELVAATVDDSVVATATLDAGKWTLAGFGSDEGAEGANDDEALEGDLEG